MTWTVNDGSESSTDVTSNVTFTATNDAPTVSGVNAQSYTEGDGAVTIDTNLTVADADSPNLSSATIQITNGYASGEDVLDCPNDCSGLDSAVFATGTLTLMGTDTVANYEAMLEDITYENTNTNDPDDTTRQLTCVWSRLCSPLGSNVLYPV